MLPNQIELTRREADLLYGMLTQRLYLRDDDEARETVVDVREKLYPMTTAHAEVELARIAVGL